MDAILLPGAILPRLAYAGALEAFDPNVNARAKELEVYRASEAPPPAYGLTPRSLGSIGSRTRPDPNGSTSSGTRPAARRRSRTRSRVATGC